QLDEAEFGRFLGEGTVGGERYRIDGADLPGVAAVVAVGERAVVGRLERAGSRLRVDADDQPALVRALGQLQGVVRARDEPLVPFGQLDLAGDVARRRPGGPVVVAVLDVGGAVARDRAGGRAGTARIPVGEQHDPAGPGVHHGARLTVRVAVALIHDLQRP